MNYFVDVGCWMLYVANEPQLTNKDTWDNTISNTADQNGSCIRCSGNKYKNEFLPSQSSIIL